MIVKMLMIINEVWLGRKWGVTRGGVVNRRRGVCRRSRGVGGRWRVVRRGSRRTVCRGSRRIVSRGLKWSIWRGWWRAINRRGWGRRIINWIMNYRIKMNGWRMYTVVLQPMITIMYIGLYMSLKMRFRMKDKRSSSL